MSNTDQIMALLFWLGCTLLLGGLIVFHEPLGVAGVLLWLGGSLFIGAVEYYCIYVGDWGPSDDRP